ncbi:hypothetical protein MTO96_013654 [Rhipicephalus appendiculatus]
MESVFLQVACSLAVAEPELEFEHRDLHCDNVLVTRTDEEVVEYLLNGRKVVVRTAGFRAFVIDYTLSRLRKGGNVVYTDLSKDVEIFGGNRELPVRRLPHYEDRKWRRLGGLSPTHQCGVVALPVAEAVAKAPQDEAARGGHRPVHQSRSTGRLGRGNPGSPASAEEFVAQHVLPHLERAAEAPRKARRAEQPPTREPHARNLRERR